MKPQIHAPRRQLLTLYQGTAGSSQGGCELFPGKVVKAARWCMSWTAKASSS